MNKMFILVALLAGFLALSIGAANAFEVSSLATEKTVCSSETALFIVDITNSGGADSFTASLSGSASKWAVAAPSGFSLNSGANEAVYVYVTPPVNALEGVYSLKISISSEQEGVEELNLGLNVNSCHGAKLTADKTDAEVCAATLAEYDLTLKNTGKYSETYSLKLIGNGADWAKLSDDLASLEGGAEKRIKVFATPPADQTGDFAITVVAKSMNSGASSSQTLTLKSNSCYDYDLMLDKNYISFCENSEAKVPVTIKNSGTTNNVYTLSIQGPSWAKVETEKIAISAESSRDTNLILFPGFGVSGDFKVVVSSQADLGGEVSKQEITVHVESCHTADLIISDSKDTLCPFNSKNYEISIANSGKYAKSFALKVFGADWAKLDRNFIDLSAGQTGKINLQLTPKNIPAGKYILKITAESQDVSKTTDSDILEIDIASPESCFGVSIISALTTVEVAEGEGALIPIIIENKGSETSTYTLDKSGTGASYAQLNPSTVTLNGGEAKNAYMYVSVPERTPQTQYKITISAKLEDGTVSSSSSIDVIVLPAKVKVETAEGTLDIARAKIKAVVNKVKAPFVIGIAKVEAFAIAARNKVMSYAKLPDIHLPKISLPKLSLPDIKLPDLKKEQTEEPVQTTETQPTEQEKTGAAQYLSEGAKKLLAKAESGTEEVKNITIIPNLGLKDKITGFASGVTDKFSGAGDKLSESGSGITDKISGFASGLKSKISGLGLGDLKAKIGPLFDKGKGFMLATTYFVPNWIWLIGLFFILAAISYMLRGEEDETEKIIKGEATEPKPEDIAKPSSADVPSEHPAEQKKKGAWKKFMDFLEEEDDVTETKPEAPKENGVKPLGEVSAQDILDAKELTEVSKEGEPKIKSIKKIIKPKAKPIKKIAKFKIKPKKVVKPKEKPKRGRKVLISEDKLIKEENDEE